MKKNISLFTPIAAVLLLNAILIGWASIIEQKKLANFSPVFLLITHGKNESIFSMSCGFNFSMRLVSLENASRRLAAMVTMISRFARCK